MAERLLPWSRTCFVCGESNPFGLGVRFSVADGVVRVRTSVDPRFEGYPGRVHGGVITAHRAFNRLWAFVEDELRVTRENAIYTQSIDLQGENVLVEIAKLGSARMYFRTRDLKYGRAVETPQGWRFELLDSATDQELVARLFDSLRKQIRQGYFQLPNALPLSQEASS